MGIDRMGTMLAMHLIIYRCKIYVDATRILYIDAADQSKDLRVCIDHDCERSAEGNVLI